MITERILKLIELKGITKYKFCKELGFSNGFLDKPREIGTDKYANILEYIPDVSPEWLLTGTGEMLKQDLYIKQKILAETEIPYEINQIHKPTKYTEKIFESQEIPLYDIHAAANLRMLFSQKNQNILTTIKLPNIPQCDGAMFTIGDSMDDLIKAGDIIFYQQINDLNNIVPGNIYVVSIDVEGEEYLTLKYVLRSEYGNDWIRLESHNKIHHPKDFELKHLNAIALVKLSIRMNTM